MRRIPALSAVLALIASMIFTLVLGTTTASAEPGDPTPDLNIKPAPGDPATVSQVAQPTWQTNGIVWAMETVGDVVYVGGNFSSVRPPGAAKGTQEQARKNLAAFNAQTGELLPFSHNFTAPTFEFSGNERPDSSCTVNYDAGTYTCDTVYEIRKSPDNSKIYVGGDFAKVDGKDRRKLAAFAAGSGALDEGFKPAGTDRRVRSLAVSANTVYVGGIFAETAGQPRTKLAAFNSADGALLPWAPDVEGPGSNGGILALTMSPDQSRVIVAGEFESINGKGTKGLDAVTASDGASAPWAWDGIQGQTFATDLTTDADTVYVTAESRTGGEFEGRAALNPNTGQARWVDDCKGASWSVAVIGDVLYSGSHAHNCSSTEGGFDEIAPERYQRLLAQTTAGDSTRILRWFPNTNGGDYSLPADRTPSRLGPRTMTVAGNTLWVGGQFTVVNGKAQQSITRFSPEAGQEVPTQPEQPQVPGPEQNPDTPDGEGNLPPVDNGTFPGGPAPDGQPDPGVDNQPAPGVGGGEQPGETPEVPETPETPDNGPRPPVGVLPETPGGGDGDNNGDGNNAGEDADQGNGQDKGDKGEQEDHGNDDKPVAPEEDTPTEEPTEEPTQQKPSQEPESGTDDVSVETDDGQVEVEVEVTETPQPTQEASNDDGGLPVTGTSLTVFVGIAVGLLAAGIVLVVASRRRLARKF